MIYDPELDSFEELTCPDLPLGIEPDVQFHECSYGPLRPGQIIVLGTDGIWEMPNAARERYGKQRLHECIRRASTLNAWEIAAALSRDLNAFRGSERQRDDVTLVIIKVLEDAETDSGSAPAIEQALAASQGTAR
jgi:sigma-B regulation protein RsbU (phosphoserine phosphatase)